MGSFLLLAVASAVLCFFDGVDGQPASFNVDKYKYTRVMESGQLVRQWGFSVDSGPRLLISSKPHYHNVDNLRPARFFLDEFDSPNHITVLRIYGVCILVPISEDYDDFVDMLEAADGTALTGNLTVLYGDLIRDNEQFNDTQREELFETFPDLRKVCDPYHTKLYELVTFRNASETEPEGKCEFRASATILDFMFHITMNKGYGHCGYSVTDAD